MVALFRSILITTATLVLCATFFCSGISAQKHDANWQPLGAYSILNETGRPTSRYLTLYVDSQGGLRGSYRDPVSDTSQRLRGRIEAATGVVRWSFDNAPLATFRTTTADLTQAFGTVEITSAGGIRERWQIARQQ
jgi:hypothetical protein